jgi:hypothetical protein
MTQTKTLATFKIDPVVWESFKIWATTQNSNAAEILRHLIGECIDGKISAPSKNNEAQQQAIAGIDERIDTRLDERIAAMEFRLDERTSERLEAVWAELAELKGQVEELRKMPLSESPVAGEGEDVGISEPVEVEAPKPAAPSGKRKYSKRGDGLSDPTARSKAKQLGWVKGCGESVEVFMARFGWRREGIGNGAKWFQDRE